LGDLLSSDEQSVSEEAGAGKKHFPGALNFIKKMTRENQLLRISTPLQSATIFLLAWKAFFTAPIIVETPPELPKSMQITEEGKNKDFSEIWGTFFGVLLGNLTPATVDDLKKQLGRYLSAEIYSDVIAEMGVEAEGIKRDRVSQSFELKDTYYETKTNKTFVSGFRVRKGLTGQPERLAFTFEFEIIISHYRPKLTYIDNYVGEPKLQSELAKEKQRDEIAKKHAVQNGDDDN
jgi:hypothetical protein